MNKFVILIIFFGWAYSSAKLKIPNNHKPLTIDCDVTSFDESKFNFEKTVTISADDNRKNGHALVGVFREWEFWVTFSERLSSREFTEVYVYNIEARDLKNKRVYSAKSSDETKPSKPNKAIKVAHLEIANFNKNKSNHDTKIIIYCLHHPKKHPKQKLVLSH